MRFIVYFILVLAQMVYSRGSDKTPDEIKAIIAMVPRGDTYLCQQVVHGKPIEKFYTLRVHNVCCYNILSQQSRQYMEDCLFNQEVVITVRSKNLDTLVGDVEYRDPETRKKTSAAQTLVRKGWSSYLGESTDRGLEILEEMAEDQRVGVWEILEPKRIKMIQDSVKEHQNRMLDTLEQEFEQLYPPIDSLIIL